MHDFALTLSLSLFSFASHSIVSPQFSATFFPSCCPSSCPIQTCPLCPTKAATGSRSERSTKVDKRTRAAADYPAVSSTVVTQQPVLTQIYRLLCVTILIKQSDAIKVLSAMSVQKAAGNIPLLHLQHTFTGRQKKMFLCYCLNIIYIIFANLFPKKSLHKLLCMQQLL